MFKLILCLVLIALAKTLSAQAIVQSGNTGDFSEASANLAIKTSSMNQRLDTLGGAETLETLHNVADVVEHYQFNEIGKAKFSVLFWDIYQSTLFAKGQEYAYFDHNQPVMLKINYLKDISKDELIERTAEQWQHLGIESADVADYTKALAKLWPNIQAGDSLALLLDSQSSTFYYNDQFLGQGPVGSFGRVFLDIWLSPNTSQPKLRQQLLGAVR